MCISNEDIDVVQASLCVYESGYILYSNRQLHLEIADRMGITKAGMCIDHEDGNRLNCSRENLRCVTHRNNALSRHILNKNNYSGYHGVSYKTNNDRWGVPYVLSKPWAAYIKIHKKNYLLGMFTTELEAASAYATVAEIVFGEFHAKTIVPISIRIPSAVAIAEAYYRDEINAG